MMEVSISKINAEFILLLMVVWQLPFGFFFSVQSPFYIHFLFHRNLLDFLCLGSFSFVLLFFRSVASINVLLCLRV